MSKATSDLQNGKHVLVVGISGPSSSGKSTLAFLLGIIFQSNSDNKSTSMYSSFYFIIIFQNIHIVLCGVELQIPNPFPSVRKRQKVVHSPIFQNSQEASKFSTSLKLKPSVSCLRTENLSYTIILAVCCAPSRQHWSVYRAQS
jgi:energy-coupling factor transporter ATP-binding protein EcfA2